MSSSISCPVFVFIPMCPNGSFQLVGFKSHTSVASPNQVASTRWTPMGHPEDWHSLSSQVSKYSWRSASTAPTSAGDQGRLDMMKGVYASAGSPALPYPTRHKPQTAAAQGAALGQTSLTKLQLRHGHFSHHLSTWCHESSGNVSEGFVRWGLSTSESEYVLSQHDFLGTSCLKWLLLL